MCLRKTGQYRSVVHCAQTVYNEGGLSTFYRGYFVNLTGIIPYAGIELAMYELCKAAYIGYFMQKQGTPTEVLESISSQTQLTISPPIYAIPVLASLASTCAIVVTYPANLIRAKLQAVYWSQSSQRKLTAGHLVRKIWRDDGWWGLYRGLSTNLAKVVPAVGISLGMYEFLRHHFELGPMGSG